MKSPISSGYVKSESHWNKLDNIPLKDAIYGSDSSGDSVVIVNPVSR